VGFAKTVAIKRLYPQYAKDPSFVSMFLDEARLAARIRHPNVIPTIDVVVGHDELFLVMEYVQGETLSNLLQRLVADGQRMPLAIATTLMAQVLRGLDAAHEACDERGQPLGVVHRDVSPQNILVGLDGQARVLDFGIAKARGRTQHTEEGQLKGKVPYMAPEQVACEAEMTRAVDIYAASVVLWEMVCGQRLFPCESQAQLLLKVLRHEIRTPRSVNPDIPEDFEAIILRGLAREPDDRFATARDMAAALERCVTPVSVADVSEFVSTHADRESLEVPRSRRGDDVTTGMDEAKRFVEQLKHRPTIVEVNRLPGGPLDDGVLVSEVLGVTEIIAPKKRRRSLSGRLFAGGALLLVGIGVGISLRTPRTTNAAASAEAEVSSQLSAPRPKPQASVATSSVTAERPSENPIMARATTSALTLKSAAEFTNARDGAQPASKLQRAKTNTNKPKTTRPVTNADSASSSLPKSNVRRQNDALFERD
jgi:serine/threonine-protein kinase